MKIELFDRFSKATEISNFMKILPVEGELLPADGRTDRHEQANSRFSKFYECTKKSNRWDCFVIILSPFSGSF